MALDKVRNEMLSDNVTAWCRFDGTLTGTNAPLDGFNVASVTRINTGDYTINFSENMDNTNYATVCTARGNTVAAINSAGTVLIGSVDIRTVNSPDAVDADSDVTSIVILGGKA